MRREVDSGNLKQRRNSFTDLSFLLIQPAGIEMRVLLQYTGL